MAILLAMHDLAGEKGYPTSRHNLVALVTWMACEGGPSLDGSWNPPQARFNPLNCTEPRTGDSWFNTIAPGIHVRNYPDFETGMAATVHTMRLKGHGYGAFRKLLFAGDVHAREILEAVEDSDWGTANDFTLQVLPSVQSQYAKYAAIPIGQ